ncbi:MAG: protoporphyrinogen oxidase [Nitrospirae bacterium]|nr:protoporphyrinogen oxidase [Nitrospirota bacterium]
MQDLTPRVGVIGGGITGLSLAHRLVELAAEQGVPLNVFLFEASDRFGGVISTRRADGFLLEEGPDSFITDRPWALDLCRRIGLEGELIGVRPESRKSYVLRNGTMIEVPEAFYLLAPARPGPVWRSPLLSLGGKLRLFCEPFVPRRRGGGDESVGGFVRRRMGSEVLDRIAQPMISGIYSADVDALSLRATLPRFARMEEEWGSVTRALRREAGGSVGARAAQGPRYSLFQTLRPGLDALVAKLVERLRPADLRHGERVTAVVRPGREGRYLVASGGGDVLADAVCVAMPAHGAAAVLKSLDPDLAGELAKLEWTTSITVNLAYATGPSARSIAASGFVVPASERRPLLGCSFSSEKFEGRAPSGFLLLRVFTTPSALESAGVPPDADDARIVQSLRPHIEGPLGLRGEPVLARVHRHERAMPVYRVGHLDWVARVQSLAARTPGLFLAGSAFEGVGVPDRVHDGERTAGECLAYLTSAGCIGRA